jgi:hypothetical protein
LEPEPWLHLQTIYQWCLNLPQKHREKIPSGKKRSKERGPKSKQNEGNPKCTTKGSWNDHVPEPPPITRSISERERNGKQLVLFICFNAKVEQSHTPFKDVTWPVAEAGEGWWVSLTTGETVYPTGWHCFRQEKVSTVADCSKQKCNTYYKTQCSYSPNYLTTFTLLIVFFLARPRGRQNS